MRRSFIGFVLACGVLGACDTGEPSAPPSWEPPTLWITGVTVRPLDRVEVGGVTDFVHADTLRGQLVFDVITHARRVDDGSNESVSGPVDAGDVIPGFIANPTVPSLSSLRFDRPILHRGSEIAAHTDLLAIDEIVQSFDGTRSDLRFPLWLSPFSIMQVRLREEAFEFVPATYTATFQWRNTGGETFADTVRVYIDLP